MENLPHPSSAEDAHIAWCTARSAVYLYESVRPTGGLLWHELTDGQRMQYRVLIEAARNATAMAAAMEAAQPADIDGAEI